MIDKGRQARSTKTGQSRSGTRPDGRTSGITTPVARRAVSPLIPALAALLAFAPVIGGCALSVNPIVGEADAIVDARLIGSWEKVGGGERAVIERGTGNEYTIEYTSDGKTRRFAGRLGRVGESMVLDVSPSKGSGDASDPAFSMMVTGHLFLVLDIGREEIAVAAFNPDTLLRALQSGMLQLPYHESNDEFVLEGSTAALREALGPYLALSGALPERERWVRARRITAGEAASAGQAAPVSVPCFEASAWREADKLFRGDPHWLGSDCASSVDLGGGRVLWLFGDTWIDPSGKGTRRGARMVSNTVAIQTGTDPAKAVMAFDWGRTDDGAPSAFIPDDGEVRHWFGSGVRVDDRLVLFLGSIVNTNTGLGFASAGWVAWMVDNPDREPSEWKMRRLETPSNVLGVSPGFTAVRRVGEYVYAFGSLDPVKSHPLYAVRWSAVNLRSGRLMAPEWWAGDRAGWVSDSSRIPRVPLFENGAPEMSIHFDEASGKFLAVQASGFGPADMMLRAAPAVTGPWTPARMLYRPAEYYRPGAMIYAAKAHPELTGADLVLTYATNGADIGDVANDTLLYYPRFVILTRCR